MSCLKLIITRHGESIWNKANKFTGWSNINMNKNGIKQSIKSANILYKNNLKPNSILTSKLIRSINTAEIIKDTLKIDNKIQYSWKLNERHYGMLEGMNREDAYAIYGKNNIKNIRENFFLLPYIINNTPVYDTNILINNEIETPIGESNNMVYRRLLPYWNDVIKKELIENKIILVVSHKNTLRCLMKIIENIDNYHFKKTNINNNELIMYNFDYNLKLLSKLYLH